MTGPEEGFRGSSSDWSITFYNGYTVAISRGIDAHHASAVCFTPDGSPMPMGREIWPGRLGVQRKGDRIWMVEDATPQQVAEIINTVSSK